jgi:hypothetical protein
VRSDADMQQGEIRFGTGAKEGTTHWKQTMFVLKVVEEVIEGSSSSTCLLHHFVSNLSIEVILMT